MSSVVSSVQRITAALPPDAVPEIVLDVDFDDERLWVPRGDSVWSLPLMFNVTQGSWVNITRARGEGVISRHRHSAPAAGQDAPVFSRCSSRKCASQASVRGACRWKSSSWSR